MATDSGNSSQPPGEQLKLSEQRAEQLAEKLIAQPPDNWQTVFTLNTQHSRITEFIPGNEDNRDWSIKITFESFIQPVSIDPIEILLQEADRYREKCKFLQHFNLFSGLENGYPTSVRLMMCGASNFSGKGEVLILKAIKGEEYFYVLKLLKRVPAFEPHQPELSKGEIAKWATYFKLLVVCNNSSNYASKNYSGKNHSCPKENSVDVPQVSPIKPQEGHN